jgi:hypothetical protein
LRWLIAIVAIGVVAVAAISVIGVSLYRIRAVAQTIELPGGPVIKIDPWYAEWEINLSDWKLESDGRIRGWISSKKVGEGPNFPCTFFDESGNAVGEGSVRYMASVGQVPPMPQIEQRFTILPPDKQRRWAGVSRIAVRPSTATIRKGRRFSD